MIPVGLGLLAALGGWQWYSRRAPAMPARPAYNLAGAVVYRPPPARAPMFDVAAAVPLATAQVAKRLETVSDSSSHAALPSDLLTAGGRAAAIQNRSFASPAEQAAFIAGLNAPSVAMYNGIGSPETQALLAHESRVEYMQRVSDDAVARSTLMNNRPDPKGQPSDQNAFIVANRGLLVSPEITYPEWGWYANTDPSHPETLRRAEYDIADGDHVRWWVNRDGSWGYYHSYGGFNVGRSLNDLVHLAGTGLRDAVLAIAHAPGIKDIPWEEIASYTESAASMVPGLGTAVSDVIATVEVAYEALTANSPLQAAIETAFDYLMASAPGLADMKPALQPFVDALVALASQENPKAFAFGELVKSTPTSPQIGPLNPQIIMNGLATMVMHKMNVSLTS